MGKGYKRKTRWRTLNIAASPGEEDDEDGIRDVKPRENGIRNSQHSTGNHKQLHRTETKSQNGVATGESTGAPPSRSQPKIIFDENEYTRITTPRQDVLFKKGYLARKKVWSSNNASTSATPSTTESQSASHSTADGSETTEDQQFLDCRDSGLEEYPPMTETAPQMSYGTFYDPSTGYYYEYPVMVVGPPMPGPPMHNLLAAMPCEAVPLRPIEWVNPAFVPKLEQPYCLIDYQNPQDGQFPSVEENGTSLMENPCTNGTDEPVENGNGSWTGSTVGDENLDEEQQNGQEETPADGEVAPEVTYPSEPCLETVLAQQLHVSPHVVPPQPYMYPGHYMFGPTLINVNGMTIQSGPMVRTTDMPAGASMCAKRRKKKKLYRRKPRRPIGQDNSEDYGPEEEEYSSEADTVNLATAFVPSSRPLNPDCKEFELRPSTIAESPSTPSPKVPDPEPSSTLNSHDSPMDPMTQDTNDPQADNSATITEVEYATEAIANELNQTHIEESQETEIGVDATCAEFSDIVDKFEVSKELSNGLSSPLQESMETIVPNGNDDDLERLSNGDLTDLSPSPEPRESISLKVLASKSNSNSRKKYKTPKIVREATPGPELDDEVGGGDKPEGLNIEVIMGIEVIEAQVPVSSVSTIGSYTNKPKDNSINDVTHEDSGFESQTHASEHRITEAVTQWLRRANSPDLFTGLRNNDNSDNEDDEPNDIEPSKNLQGNPMPALSANSVVINDKNLSRPAGEFATRRRKRNANKRKKKQLKLLMKNACEFPDKDSVAGMRVAESTRIDDDRREINDERSNESTESSRDNGLRDTTDVDGFKTYEQGEIVVTNDGKLLSGGAPPRREGNQEGITEQKSEINSIGSIEEPDVLEYWEVETVEPFVNPKTMEKRESSEPRGACDVDPAGLEIVRKYYRLARNSVQSGSSIDDDAKSIKSGLRSRLTSPDIIKHFDRQMIDEGIEIYESCYSGKPPIYFDPHFQRSKFSRRDDEGALPCRVTCCNVQ
ncbi:uncharacterized protein LOC107042351 [Diachasma alloeum]|uniref:uncharacterized protein LOC107042351 n=1 Tax=Diachasma alloeum TaxID=454923 RepID=UPI0007383726|nr:uncharacterized protein LOC107042351 [Diachasma alloeum]